VHYAAISALSHEGVVRDHNEDSTVVGPWTTCATVTHTPETFFFPISGPLVAAVADGLGGHSAGEVASTLVVQELAQRGHAMTDEQSVRAVLDVCNRAVYDAGSREPDWTGMGTTVAGVVITDASVLVFNVGDSRVYAFGEEGLTRLSVDDNPPLAPGETHSSVLTQTIGGHPRDHAIEPHLLTRPRGHDGRLLICTDGLTDVVDDDAIASVLAANEGQQATFELWRSAIEAGGPDNITLLTVEFGTSDDDG
jgi:PPM family protein phosphatase